PGGAAILLIHRLGQRSDAILRENYDSVRAMERLADAALRLDGAFRLALEDPEHEAQARRLYRAARADYRRELAVEEANVTIFPEEERLVRRLRAQTDRYLRQGEAFFAAPSRRRALYTGKGGLGAQHDEIRRTTRAIFY